MISKTKFNIYFVLVTGIYKNDGLCKNEDLKSNDELEIENYDIDICGNN